MSEKVEMGIAGSLTILVLVVAVAVLLRSFYRRYTRLAKRKDDATE
ncbi:hypothetical protein LBMAG10_14610 [Actinomycetes bacterium]|nr:hypothetical protein LBMAG10_14610 [Actinomycetes bacterium]